MKSARYGRWLPLFTLLLCFSAQAVSSKESGVSQSSPKKMAKIHKDIDLRAELTGRDLKKLGEDDLYVEVLTQYQTQNYEIMRQAVNVLITKYQDSPHSDNALYLLGYSSLERRAFADALRNFNRLLKRYPASNKAVAAEFAKGIAYKHMKLRDLAQRSFLSVRKKYPGSPESFRAESELKLLVKR